MIFLRGLRVGMRMGLGLGYTRRPVAGTLG